MQDIYYAQLNPGCIQRKQVVHSLTQQYTQQPLILYQLETVPVHHYR